MPAKHKVMIEGFGYKPRVEVLLSDDVGGMKA